MNVYTFIGQEWLLNHCAFRADLAIILSGRKASGLPIASAEVVRLMNSDEAVVVDVRPSSDFNNGHIHGAINIPHSQFANRVSELEKKRDKLIVSLIKWASMLELLANF